MTPYYQDDWLTVFHGDCRAVMAEMEPESVHCVVTSPPYWGLRDYGESGQLGLEPTPEQYVANLVAVFREVRRVLRADGTVWLVLGDSYAASPGQRKTTDKIGPKQDTNAGSYSTGSRSIDGLAAKQLVGIPWRVAFALQADGWYLRSDIIWAKPNPMPESVTDRPTKSHEYIFLLSKSPRYYFDADAVREPDAGTDHWRGVVEPIPSAVPNSGAHHGIRTVDGRNGTGRNIRSVWTMATQPYPGAHFATFPETLPERCIKAGTSEKGVCPECGAPWKRVVKRVGQLDEARPQARRALALIAEHGLTPAHLAAIRAVGVTDAGKARTTQNGTGRNDPNVQALADEAKRALGGYYREVLLDRGSTSGWRPSCSHVHQSVPATVLDPFAGSGTTGMVAQSLSRRAVLIDLSLDYLGQLMARNAEIPLGLTQ